MITSQEQRHCKICNRITVWDKSTVLQTVSTDEKIGRPKLIAISKCTSCKHSISTGK